MVGNSLLENLFYWSMVLVTTPPPHTPHNKMVSPSAVTVILSKWVLLFSMIHHYLFHIGLMLSKEHPI